MDMRLQPPSGRRCPARHKSQRPPASAFGCPLYVSCPPVQYLPERDDAAPPAPPTLTRPARGYKRDFSRRSVDLEAVDGEHRCLEAGLQPLGAALAVRRRMRPHLQLAAAGLHPAAALEVREISTAAQIPPRSDPDLTVVVRLDDDAVVADAVRGHDLVEARQVGPVDV